MSRELLNTLFVMTQGAYVHLDGETLVAEAEGKPIIQTPLHHIGNVVIFGRVMLSPLMIHKCAEEGRNITLLDINGRFKARLVGPTTGNVLLRRSQYRASEDKETCSRIARCIVAGKLQNCRSVILRAARECKSEDGERILRRAAQQIARVIESLPAASSIEEIRGCEGLGTAAYFEAFDSMIFAQRTDFKLTLRTRRPPRDRVNALLSFLYALLANDCISAVESVGLDPQIGYLHAVRPGRPALALDLMEEFRPAIAERLTLSLINLRQIKPADFDVRPGESVLLNDAGRKTVIVAYQKRKQDEISHPLLKTKIPFGLVPYLQARLLARCIRGETEVYVPYMPR